ncbi:type I methionyl aminopeptidase [Haloechinothrix sp. LS1_15]|uniref:type I methionyl aminopeptidase n=1 Tax=Haloechinothrix sp. LS1_15 TaxID=2652248 RepID=UPI0029487D18|nr:type I methionyl aminopeptidase [Haloechinothrix sp. LS1_15]MDV6013108.1 type I methionyl aminopeptidase [Haloechinothrix sp. LS1_15]
MSSRFLRMLRGLRRKHAIELKSPGELEAMRASGLIVARTLAAIEAEAKPGISTAELDELAEQRIRDAGAVPAFKGYHGFPRSICASVNERVVHGIPAADEVLEKGDLLSVDCGAILDGWHGDAAVTIEVGEVTRSDQILSRRTREAMLAGVAAARPGGRLTDISHAVQCAVEEAENEDDRTYGLITEYGGHGIGRAMHMEPFLPNAGSPGRGPRLAPGMALAIEPMLTGGSEETLELEDGWTVVTADGSRAAHWEHTVAITADGPWVLTSVEETRFAG